MAAVAGALDAILYLYTGHCAPTLTLLQVVSNLHSVRTYSDGGIVQATSLAHTSGLAVGLGCIHQAISF